MNTSDPRLSYRKRLMQRQTVVFGALSVALVLLMLLAMGWWTGILPFPFNKDFKPAPTSQADTVPCVVEGTPAVATTDLTVNVYNASDSVGLAERVSSKLTQFGVTVAQQGNWPGSSPEEQAIIYASSDAVPQAYSLARMFTDATVLLDGTEGSHVLDVVLGPGFTTLAPDPQLAELSTDDMLGSPENCQPVEN